MLRRLLSSSHLPAAALASVALGYNRWGKPTEACGIVGVIGSRDSTDQADARGFLLEGLQVLRNRGYDSAGIATIGNSSDGAIVCTKYASRGDKADSIDLLREKTVGVHEGHRVGIAHTRWATHGGKTDANAHPHCDMRGLVALVHNGIISNANELRRELQAKGVVFTSETDTEVVAQLIGQVLHEAAMAADLGMQQPGPGGGGGGGGKQGSPLSLKEATAKALRRCEGTWGLAIMAKGDPDELVVACNGSPMCIGLGAGKTFIASEPAAFNRFTKNFIAMQDGEIGVVRADGTSLDLGRVQLAPELEIQASPDPYPHWTIKECLEQPAAIARALGFGGRMSDDKVYLGGLDRHKARMASIRHLVLAGCGTSMHAGIYGAKLMREYDAFDTVICMDAAEIREHDLPRSGGGVLAVSQSGETKDVHRAVVTAQREGIPTISVVNAVGSLIARTTQLGVYCHAGRENAVASTKAFTTQVTCLALLTCWFRQLRDDVHRAAAEVSPDGSVPKRPVGRESTLELMEALQRLPISFGMANRLRPQCQEVAKRLVGKEHCFILGKGYGEPIAYEGALKIKECAYLHAEGYSGGALKHGPFALIEGKEGKFGATPIILLVLDDEFSHQMRSAAEEVKARGADLIIITDNAKLADGLDKNPLVIPRNGPLTALAAVLPLQLIAYELAVLKGLNPDVPRNLAKAVTVD